MLPRFDQIERAAYDRWLRRGCVHGHDREDWFAAEQDMLFALNYEVVACHRLDGASRRYVGSRSRRVCRFCERAAPAASFADGRLALPDFVGNSALATFEECDECHEHLAEEIDAELERFLARWRAGRTWAAAGAGAPPGARITIPVLKGFARMALAILPAAELQSFEETIEWVGNPDHDLDVALFSELGYRLRGLPSPCPGPWAALARRVDEDVPMPYMLFYLGTADSAFLMPVPLCARDEDLEGQTVIVPRTCAPLRAFLETARHEPAPAGALAAAR